jgi:hypothetical protein
MRSVKLNGAMSTDHNGPAVWRADFADSLEHAARIQGGVLGAGSAPLAAGIAELILGLVPSLGINDGFMLSLAAAIPLQPQPTLLFGNPVLISGG